MNQPPEHDVLAKIETGISGFDVFSEGGLPKGRTSLVTGTAGSGKTIFACQFLIEGIKRGQNGVFVSFEESPKMLRKNMRGLGWDIQAWEQEGKWSFVDVSPQDRNLPVVSGEYELDPLITRFIYAIERVNAQRVAMDSLGAIFSYVPNIGQVRSVLFKLAQLLREMEITAVLTSERTADYGEISRYGIEEFVADNVIILRNSLVEEKRRRTIEILKFRGVSHQHGEFPFTIVPEQGIVVIPFSTDVLKRKSSRNRITSGNQELDAMCGGGWFEGSIILVSGATGTGKTLMATEFIKGGVKNGEKCLLFAFEESRDQLLGNALGWGVDFERMERENQLKIVCYYPEITGLESHFVKMRTQIEQFQPQRIAIDSISALEKVSTLKAFREFLLTVNTMIKEKGITCLCTANTPSLVGSESITESNVSTNTDLIVLLRYVEVYGEIRRGLAVLKMRGSKHDKDIREFLIDDRGMHLGQAFRNITGILAGNPSLVNSDELDRLNNLFKET
ncbi:circadian clock protein KaiC [Stanieria cyanosphaera PCC 7437]|uniref:non-specific serine/threonine protein kinase n=1 Tax=Stanieria cyanosphaera (strain ATCC 29371 / PCC 7437) TaxID=111780 RepID=K9XSG5_STAC7|nr:circadian clock protein KaiC [Stanieria cyanosphaera]AFZ35540.1 circadian clock protein KaiC [Stanieria cyanosphaera PCC 7437]